MDNNPSHGNKHGGLTTILQKSPGAVAKGGTAPLSGVGATLIVFTTGRGSVSGYKPSPCLKLATNTEMYARMKEDMDINCGDILDGVSIKAKGEEIMDKIIATANSEQAWLERLGFSGTECVPWQIGAVM